MTTIATPALRRLAAAAALLASLNAADAASPAASACPDYTLGATNLAQNPNFEIAAPDTLPGQWKCWRKGDPSPVGSAAGGWRMHSNNLGATVCSAQLPGGSPGPSGSKLLAFQAGANEGGIYQDLKLDPRKAYMFSVWVYVRSGHVAIQSNSTTGGPVAWTSKIGEWEQLRVCTNSLWSTNQLVIYNQAGTGGLFYVDRAELREIPIRE